MDAKKIPALFLMLTLIFALPQAGAQDTAGGYDPLKRNLLYVSGEAKFTVPINQFALTFGFDQEKGSFAETQAASQRIIDGISSRVKSLGLSEVEVVKGWDVVKQARISLGSKGRKISTRLVVKVRNFPAGKMHELISQVIDNSLTVDGSVALEDVQVSLSEELEARKNEEAVQEALKKLQQNAKNAAASLGRNLAAPKSITISSGGEPVPMKQRQVYGDAMMMERSFVSVQKSFNVESEIVDHVRISARVDGTYELE